MEILSTTPTNDTDGTALETTIQIEFDEEVDPATILEDGGVVVSTSSSKLFVQGPSLEQLYDSNEDYLSSRSFTGIVEGAFTTADNITFVFTPTHTLEPNKLYTTLVSTDVVTRTIGDITADPGNTSTGIFTLSGPYTDNQADSVTVEVVDGGDLGTATFKYKYNSVGVWSSAAPTDRTVSLLDGVDIHFKTGTFVAGDTWTFDLTEGIPLGSIYKFSFTTGPETYEEVSADTPSYDIQVSEVEGHRRIDGVSTVDSADFAVLEMVPEHRDTNLALSHSTITITFNKDIDASSLDNATIQAIMENLPMDEALQQSVNLPITTSVSGNTLTIKFTG